MGDAIDRFAKALAKGRSRREAALGLLAGGAALLPWTSEAQGRRKKKQHQNQRYLDYCKDWCEFKFQMSQSEVNDCISAAKRGNGPCYSSSAKGPGYFCTKVKHCHNHKYCCPVTVEAGGQVTDGLCCPKGKDCGFLNATVVGDRCEF